MKRIALILLALAGFSLAACAPHAPDPDRFAEKFFEHGKDTILDTLEDQKIGDAKLATARGIMERYALDVRREIAAAMRSQQELMLALTSGRNADTLLKLDADQNRAQQQVLRTVGRMHEELEAAVGAETWKAASADLEKHYSRYFKHKK